MAVRLKDQWFTYDGENRLKVVNGVLASSAIQVATDDAESYTLLYDGVGQATGYVLRKMQNGVVTAGSGCVPAW